MSDFNINNITSREGQQGTVLAGITTVNSTGAMRVPSGPTDHRGGRGRGFFGGGYQATPAGNSKRVSYIEIATTGDSVSFGDLTAARQKCASFASATRGIWAGGKNPSNDTVIDYIVTSSQGGANDFGDLIVANKPDNTGVSDSIRGMTGGGENPAVNNTIEYVIQKEQKGTGHAIMQCLPSIENFEGNILILSGDVPLIQTQTLLDFIKSHNENNSSASLISTDLEEPGGYGRIIKNNNQQLTGIVEHKDATDNEKLIKEINSGIYIFNVNTLKESLLLITNNNVQKEYYLTEVFDFIDSQTTFVKKIKRSNEILGVNNLEELNELENYTFNEN